MDDAEKERKRKALAAMMGGESVSDIGTRFDEAVPKKQCPDCHGRGTCPACRGGGAGDCATCNGKGEVPPNYSRVSREGDKIITFMAGASGATCPDCLGSGVSCGEVHRYKPVYCARCGGSGKCPKCSGTGQIDA